MDALQRAVPIPQLKIEMRRALERRILPQSLPLAAAQSGRNERAYQRPLRVAHIARITKAAAING